MLRPLNVAEGKHTMCCEKLWIHLKQGGATRLVVPLQLIKGYADAQASFDCPEDAQQEHHAKEHKAAITLVVYPNFIEPQEFLIVHQL